MQNPYIQIQLVYLILTPWTESDEGYMFTVGAISSLLQFKIVQSSSGVLRLYLHKQDARAKVMQTQSLCSLYNHFTL